jgi:hypothetical protein
MSFDTMNKGALISACIARGLPMDGLSVVEMRAALNAHEAGKVVAEAAETVQEPAEAPGFDTPAAPTEVLPEPEPALEQAPVVAAEPVPEAPVLAPVPALIVPPVAVVPRAESNGVKMPAPGTICRQIWDHCESVYASGSMPQAKALRAWGAGRLDDVTMTVQFYRWRKFRGISGRQA